MTSCLVTRPSYFPPWAPVSKCEGAICLTLTRESRETCLQKPLPGHHLILMPYQNGCWRRKYGGFYSRQTHNHAPEDTACSLLSLPQATLSWRIPSLVPCVTEEQSCKAKRAIWYRNTIYDVLAPGCKQGGEASQMQSVQRVPVDSTYLFLPVCPCMWFSHVIGWITALA